MDVGHRFGDFTKPSTSPTSAASAASTSTGRAESTFAGGGVSGRRPRRYCRSHRALDARRRVGGERLFTNLGRRDESANDSDRVDDDARRSISEPRWQRLPRRLQLLLPVVPATVFVSYRRRDDLANDAALLAVALQARLGKGAIYFDKTTNLGGDDWLSTIERWATMSRRMLVIIGPRWQGPPGAPSRIAHDDDIVRHEVGLGLRNARSHRRRRLLACLLPGAEMPQQHELPDELAGLLQAQAIHVDPRQRLDDDVEAVLRGLRLRSQWHRWWAWFAALVCAALLAVIGPILWNQRLDLLAKAAARAPTAMLDDGRYRLGDADGLTARQISPFEIDRHEASWVQFVECQRRGPCDDTIEPPGDDTTPVVGLTAGQAAAFCEWLGRRLPTFAEWETAVRGSSARAWPWGDDPPSGDRVDIDVGGAAQTSGTSLAPVDGVAFTGGDTPEGVRHLVGNAAEWTATDARCIDPYACGIEWDRADPLSAVYVVGGSYRDIIDDPTDVLGSDDLPGLVSRRQASEGSIAVGVRCAAAL